jgi:hypothetical protein
VGSLVRNPLLGRDKGWLHMDVVCYVLCMLKQNFHLPSRRDQIKVAMDYLTSPELADKQVQFIVETQLLLKPYLEGREEMHLL